MSDARITRRTVLAGAAAAGAGSLVSPVAGLADVLGREPSERQASIFSRWVGSLAGESGELPAPRRFALLGVQWDGPADARIELRVRAHGGAWCRWALASELGHGPDRPARPRPLVGDPIWTGPADFVQLRTSRPVHGVRVHFVSVAIPGAATAASFPLAQPLLDAGGGQPPIIARDAWSHGAPPSVPPVYGAVKMAFVHHTDNPNGYSAAEVPAMLLAIYQFHRFVRGWNDIGYNFVIDLFGRIWEARKGGIDQAVVGAQAGGYNLESTGVSVLGTFTDVVPSHAAIDSLERLLAWKLSLHGLPALGNVTVVVDPADAFFTPFKPGAHVSLPRVAGHRQGDTTDCPGNAFFARLPSIRPVVAQLAGTPATLTLTMPSADAAVAVAPAAVVLAGRLRMLHGAPLAGAAVELQTLASGGVTKTFATVTTAADGTWSSSIEVSRNTLVQALHREAPAVISELVEIAVAPSIEVTVESTAPLRVTGQITPAKRRATIDVYALRGLHRRLVARRRVVVRRGQFAATIPLRGAGRHVLVARTQPDAANAAGASKAIALG